MRTICRLLLPVVIFLTSCTGGENDRQSAFEPRFEEIPCPRAVTDVVVIDASCGMLTVPENRSDPEGPTVRVFFTRLTPPGDLAPDPWFVPSTDFADSTNYGGLAPAAERVGREVILMDARGVGHSEPSLACPEVDELTADALAVGARDPSMRQRFLDAVEACYDRLVSERVDPSSYSLADVAADAVDLRAALGVDAWTVATYGTGSRVAFEIARMDPQGVRALFLDSPDVPEIDPFTEAIEGTRAALARVAGACASDRSCNRAFPNLDGSIAKALKKLKTRPVEVAVETSGEPATVVYDDVRFLVSLRQLLSDGGSTGGFTYTPSPLPATVAAAVDDRLDGSPGSLAAGSTDDQPYCTGFMPKCTPIHRHSYGALLSFLCADVTPFVDADALASLAEDPSYVDAFANSPFLDACDRWEVEPADAPAESFTGDVPTFVELGAFDPYANPSVVKESLGKLPQAHIFVAPGLGHNISASGCLIELRAAWAADPTAPIAGAGCVEELAAQFLIPGAKSAPGPGGAFPEGSYIVQVTKEDLLDHGFPPQSVWPLTGTLTWTLEAGRWSLRQEGPAVCGTGCDFAGTYESGRKRITTTLTEGEPSCAGMKWSARWEQRNGEIVFSDVTSNATPTCGPRSRNEALARGWLLAEPWRPTG